MGQAVDTLKIQQEMHSIAFLPIHKFMYQLVPYMEHRQQAAKKWMESRNEQTKQACEDAIKDCDKAIAQLLKLQIECLQS